MSEIHHPTRCECCFEQCCGGVATEPMCVGYADGLAEGRQLERTAIVAWLKETFDKYPELSLHSAMMRIAAGIHARADHLRPDIKDGEGECNG